VDTGHSFWASQEAEPGIAARYYMNRNFFVSDPDAFTVSRQSIYDHSWPNSTVPLTLNEAQVSIVLAALAGGMYEIEDDLPTLGADPDRLALVKNSDLLTMVRRGRAAIPLDLMSYRNQDQQPSVFLLHETRHETIVAVFNWTEQPRSHILTVTQLGLPPGHSYWALDVLDGDKPVSVRGGVLRLDNQARHSVKLIKLIDAATPLPER
jgi:alpha-galactosidase